MADASTASPHVRIILFYKYHPLSPESSVTNQYRESLERLCIALKLRGRILVGVSETEGLNGTLAGSEEGVRAFTFALLHDTESLTKLSDALIEPVYRFWDESKIFFEKIDKPQLKMNSPDDFKWSTSSAKLEVLFPDLNIKLVSELIGTGGKLANISLEETAQGYLTPQEWNDALKQVPSADDTVVIDCRNTKEFEIGHFDDALDPGTTNFSQFPDWVNQHETVLSGKKVLMYCTGGIRCEKASAYVRKQVPSVKEVKHLKGGIHKWLEEYGDQGDSGFWKGRNFVFDGRQAATAHETKVGSDRISELESSNATPYQIVGSCLYCNKPYDEFHPLCVCAVCREPVLACPDCRVDMSEFHCRNHFHLRECYFADLARFSTEELRCHLEKLKRNLEPISVGRKFKQRRRTLQRQMERINEKIEKGGHPTMAVGCRSCKQANCDGRCWGFFGLQRKEVLTDSASEKAKGDFSKQLSIRCQQNISNSTNTQKPTVPAQSEIVRLDMWQPPTRYRDPVSGIRTPPCTVREVQCSVKAKWSGRSVVDMVKHEFCELSKPGVLTKVMDEGLLRINGNPVTCLGAPSTRLKTSDRVSRLVHWHEAPVIMQRSTIEVSRVALPKSVRNDYDLSESGATICVCSKPATVPVHSAGPYFANCLLPMVEAQEKLEPGSLKPVHRIDRVTSGLTLCCTDKNVVRLFHRSLTEGAVEKCYLTRVHGDFPLQSGSCDHKSNEKGSSRWIGGGHVEVDVPVATIDPGNGIRAADAEKGKPSKSIFKKIEYDPDNDITVVSCFPVTGRSHQLRVHLQWLGFPIVGDIQYGGRQSADDERYHLAAVERMEALRSNVTNTSRSAEEHESSVRACSCCRNGVASSFTEPQLLKYGHRIDLHALRYRLRIFPRGKKRKIAEEKSELIEFSVQCPEWTKDCSDLLKNITWPDRGNFANEQAPGN